MAKLIRIDDKICEREGCDKKATHLLLADMGRFGKSIAGFFCGEHAEHEHEDQDYKEDHERP